MRETWWEQEPQPRQNDRITCGAMTIHVGSHNGDFRNILIDDHLGRHIASGSVPYRALRDIIDAGSDYKPYVAPASGDKDS